MVTTQMPIIGTNALVSVQGLAPSVPAKIDTGADGTAIWASEIHLDESGVLHYTLFDETSPLYTGEEYETTEYAVVRVTGSTGNAELRFRVKLVLTMGGKTIKAWCSLTDRSERTYPMLIGKRTLKGKFLVDVAKSEVDIKKESSGSVDYQDEFEKDPQAFLKAYEDQLIIRKEQ